MTAQQQHVANAARPDNLDIDALVVGAGFGGTYLLHLLRKQGLSVKLFEAGAGFGGVWNASRYPGARVDSEFPYYGFSDPDIWASFFWTEQYPGHEELRRYFAHVDKVWDLSKDASFNTRVTEARWQEDDGKWLVETADGRQCRCTYFFAATGTSFKQHTPEWKGFDSFKGEIHHSSLWPHEGIDLRNKRVAVIGAGCTGIQIVQEAAKVASHLTQFIRTPNYAIPMRQRVIDPVEIDHYKSSYQHVFKACRQTKSGLPMVPPSEKTFDVSPEKREEHWEEVWRRGGFNFNLGAYADAGVDEKANRMMYDFWAKKIRARISDPVKRDLLAPLEPPYPFSTKRPCLEQDYYEMINRTNVDVVAAPITEFTEEGIISDGKLHKFDIVALATGYDAVTGGLATMGIKGRNGEDLGDKWKEGVKTAKGLMAHGFPNFFFVYGPQAPTSFTNGGPFIEIQCEVLAESISRLREAKKSILEPTRKAEEDWTNLVREIAEKTLICKVDSWYTGANVPGKKREVLLYLGGIPAYEKACWEALEGWKGYEIA